VNLEARKLSSGEGRFSLHIGEVSRDSDDGTRDWESEKGFCGFLEGFEDLSRDFFRGESASLALVFHLHPHIVVLSSCQLKNHSPFFKINYYLNGFGWTIILCHDGWVVPSPSDQSLDLKHGVRRILGALPFRCFPNFDLRVFGKCHYAWCAAISLRVADHMN